MTLHPIHSEFPWISGNFFFLFYQCSLQTNVSTLSEVCLSRWTWSMRGYDEGGYITMFVWQWNRTYSVYRQPWSTHKTSHPLKMWSKNTICPIRFLRSLRSSYVWSMRLNGETRFGLRGGRMTGIKYWNLIYSAKIAEYIWMEASLCLEGGGEGMWRGGGRDGSGWPIRTRTG